VIIIILFSHANNFFLGVGRESIKSQEGVCSDSPITYNVTLRGGIHSGNN